LVGRPSHWPLAHILVKVLLPTRHKIGHFGDTLQANFLAWYGKKQNLTQQNDTYTYQNKCTTTQNKHKITKARFSRLLRHPAWKWRGPILVSVHHKSVTYLLKTLTHLLTAPEPTRAKNWLLKNTIVYQYVTPTTNSLYVGSWEPVSLATAANTYSILMSTGCRGGCDMEWTGLSAADDCMRFTDNINNTLILSSTSCCLMPHEFLQHFNQHFSHRYQSENTVFGHVLQLVSHVILFIFFMYSSSPSSATVNFTVTLTFVFILHTSSLI